MKSTPLMTSARALGLLLICFGPLAALAAAPEWGEPAEPPASGWRMSNQLSPSPAVPRPVLTAGSPNGTDARFDLTVNNAPAAQVFLQLGAGTAYNILVSPDLTGTISIGLKNTTVPEAMDVLRELFGYDYRISGNRVFVYPNTVQTRIYRINYLQGRRQGASDLHVSSGSITQAGASSGSSGGTSGSSSSGSSGGSGGSGGSSTNRGNDTSSVRMTSDTDFWREVQESLVAMVGTAGGRGVTLNPGAGMVVVRATPAELRQVADYLRAVQVNIERQVMLEAKIVEVQLTKDAQSGVNWTLFKGIGGGARAGLVNVAPGTTLNRTGNTISTTDGNLVPGDSVVTSALGRGLYGLAVSATNFSALLTFLETQGDVQVLSSPRIATMNNQKAVLKVGTDELFVTGVSTTTTTSASGNVSSPNLTLQPFFSGISLDVTPQIDDTGTVMLHVHPAISVVSEKQKTIDLGETGVFKLPLATSAINETDSIVRVHDGAIVAIGGLMTQSASADRSGVPGLSEVPIMGGLFRQRSSSSTKHELVILIRPTIIGEDGAGWNSSEPSAPLISRSN
jgi:MSHA biogenesis protein MshL